MATVVKAGVTISTAANTKSADQITGQYQYVGKGMIALYARGSAAGMNHTLSVAGIPLVNDESIPFFGATGSLSQADHLVLRQMVSGGRIEYTLRNTSGGALTTDYLITFEPMK